MAHADPRMGAFDAVMFGVEGDPLLRSVITLVVMLDTTPTTDVITTRLDYLTRINPRLRQRAVGNPFSPAPPRWETDPNFDADYHLRWRRGDPARPAMSEVLDYAQHMSEADFDHARPLWEASIITGLADDVAAFVLKIHHSITDGLGGMAMASAMFDISREPADLGEMPDAPLPHPAGALSRLTQMAGFELRATREILTRGTFFAASSVKNGVTDPLGTLRAGVTTATAAARMLAPQGKPLSTLMTDRCLSSKFSVLDIPLDDMKAAATASGTTLNTCFIAAVVGGIRAYHERFHWQLPEIRVNMPISVRTENDDPGGNRWVPARFVIPTRPDDPLERLRVLEPVLRDAQTDPALRLSTLIYEMLTALPRPVTTSLAGSLMKGVDVAATNVPGPSTPIYLAGAEVTAMVAFAPKAGAAINIGLMSYAGHAFLGINCDPAAVTDPTLLTACVQVALDDVLALGDR